MTSIFKSLLTVIAFIGLAVASSACAPTNLAPVDYDAGYSAPASSGSDLPPLYTY